jgi:Aspartyl protease
MKKLILIQLIFSVQIVYCQTESFDFKNNGGKIINQDFSIKIPFKINAVGLIVIPISIKDTVVDFIFDTAAGASAIDKKFYDKFNGNTVGKDDVKDSNGVLNTLNVVEYDTCRIGDLALFKMPFTLTDMTRVVQNASGMLGANIINKLNWFVDYDALIITITDKTLKKEGIITKVNINYNENNIPFAALKVGSELIENIKFDFGSNGGIDVSKNVFKKLSPFRCSEIKINIGNSLGLYGASELDTISSFPIENLLKLDTFRIPFTRLSSLKNNISIIGQKFFSIYNIGIDNKEKCYYFYKRKNGDYDSNYESFPLSFKWEKNQISVSRKHSCLSLINSDIIVGDELESINNKMANEFDNEDEFISWYYEEETLLIKLKNNFKSVLIKKEKDCGK